MTPLTKETFEKWKVDQKEKKRLEVEKKVKSAMDKKPNVRLGATGALSGRDLFTFDPSLFVDDADAANDAEMEIQSSDEEDDEKENASATEKNISAQLDESLFLDGDVPDEA